MKLKFEDSNYDDDDIDNVSYETSNVYGFGHEAYVNVLDTLSICEPLYDGHEGLKVLKYLLEHIDQHSNHVCTFSIKLLN